ncbi:MULTISPECIES: HNH endonuclease [Methylotenera]|uniref:HNH endonuclease n=1 Tax=Methylotenera TaxID=359407 RepID=UPI00035D6C86|nr:MULTISPECIES: HNH endonuclease signature motif containing protein [Methylotenera]
MKYWWVNQNQTYKHEVGGGYMWSPKTNSNGQRNQFYINMTLVMPGDVIYSFCDTYIKAIGIVVNKAVSSIKPNEFGNAGLNWNDDGWFVEVDFQELETPIKPANHMDLLLPTLPDKYSPLQANGNGNQVYLASVPITMSKVLNVLLSDQIEKIIDRAEFTVGHEDDQNVAEEKLLNRKDIPETEKHQLIKARRGQGLFRSRVGMIEKACRITGVSKKSYLRASHIKPWCKSTDLEKLDGNNGLMLSPHIDYLFDKGLISFSNDGVMLVSKNLDADILQLWNIKNVINLGRFNPDQSNYLEYHRNHVFLKN